MDLRWEEPRHSRGVKRNVAPLKKNRKKKTFLVGPCTSVPASLLRKDSIHMCRYLILVFVHTERNGSPNSAIRDTWKERYKAKNRKSLERYGLWHSVSVLLRPVTPCVILRPMSKVILSLHLSLPFEKEWNLFFTGNIYGHSFEKLVSIITRPPSSQQRKFVNFWNAPY